MTDHKVCAEEYVADAQRAVEILADELISIAEHLKTRAPGFASGEQLPTSLAADIVSNYMNMSGRSGVRLGNIVYSASKAEWHRAQMEAENGD